MPYNVFTILFAVLTVLNNTSEIIPTTIFFAGMTIWSIIWQYIDKYRSKDRDWSLLCGSGILCWLYVLAEDLDEGKNLATSPAWEIAYLIAPLMFAYFWFFYLQMKKRSKELTSQ